MDNMLSKNFENNATGMKRENVLIPDISENTRKRRYTEEVTNDSAIDNVACNWQSSSKKQVHGLSSATCESNVKQCSQMLNSKQKSSEIPLQSTCQTENDKQIVNHTVNLSKPNSNQMIEQNINCNQNRTQTCFSNSEGISGDTPVWLSNINHSQRVLLNWHPFHHRLYLRQQLEMERRRVSLLKNSSRNMLGFNRIFIEQIGRGMIPSQADEKDLKLMRLIAANTRILSSEETVSLEEATCVICFMKFKEQQSIRELSCLHKFHKSCIDKWLVNQMNCPICRLPLGQKFATNDSTISNVNCSINNQFLLSSQTSVPVSNLYYHSKEMNNLLNANDEDSTDSETIEPAQNRDFENNLAISQENNINITLGSGPDINNDCTQNFLLCNQSENQETTDETNESPTIQVTC